MTRKRDIRIVRASELAGWLKVHRQTVWNRVKRGKIPAPTVRVSRREVAWDAQALLDWMKGAGTGPYQGLL